MENMERQLNELEVSDACVESVLAGRQRHAAAFWHQLLLVAWPSTVTAHSTNTQHMLQAFW
jgi:cobalamin biosynthesis protein CobD/CbiB